MTLTQSNSNLQQDKLANGTLIAWTMNENRNTVMVNSGFAGIVELHTQGSADKSGVYAVVTFEWRDKDMASKMPAQVENVTLEAAKNVAKTAYMFHGG